MYFCLKTPYLMYIVATLTLNSCQQHYNLCLNEASLTHTFSPKGTSQPFCTQEHYTVLQHYTWGAV